MTLCEALAASGDGRGLPDAFEVLLDLKRPAEPPLDEQKRKDWDNARDQTETGGRGRLRTGLESGPRRIPRPQVRRRHAGRAGARASTPLASAGVAQAVRPRRPRLGQQPRPPGRRAGQAAARSRVDRTRPTVSRRVFSLRCVLVGLRGLEILASGHAAGKTSTGLLFLLPRAGGSLGTVPHLAGAGPGAIRLTVLGGHRGCGVAPSRESLR